MVLVGKRQQVQDKGMSREVELVEEGGARERVPCSVVSRSSKTRLERNYPQLRHPSNTDRASYTMTLSFGNHLFLSSTTFTRVKIHGILRAL